MFILLKLKLYESLFVHWPSAESDFSFITSSSLKRISQYNCVVKVLANNLVLANWKTLLLRFKSLSNFCISHEIHSPREPEDTDIQDVSNKRIFDWRNTT